MSIYKNNQLIAGGRQCMPLLSFMWADHVLNDASWLNSTTFSWQSGAVYQAAYQHLSADITGKTLQSETISGTTIQFYLADDGHKICPASQESNVTAIYNATGVAWYYIIDTVNERFKLPRAKHNKYAATLGVVGNGISPEFVNLDNNTKIGDNLSAYTNQYSGNNVLYLAGTINSTTNAGLTTDPTKSGIIAQQEQDTDQYKYLYFYVGNFTQTALENTAGITAETLNDKVDKGHHVIAFQAPTALNNYTWYRKYADGWVEQGGYVANSGNENLTITLPVPMANSIYDWKVGISYNNSSENATYYQLSIWNQTATSFVIRRAGNIAKTWRVSGKSAN